MSRKPSRCLKSSREGFREMQGRTYATGLNASAVYNFPISFEYADVVILSEINYTNNMVINGRKWQ